MSTSSPHLPSTPDSHLGRIAAAAIVVAAVTILVVIGLAPRSADAAQSSFSQPDPEAVPAYAIDFGVSQQVAYSNLSRLPGLLDNLSQVRTTAGTRIAGWGVDHGTSMTAWVLLTGNAPAPGLEGLAAASGIDVRYGATMNYAQLTSVQSALTDDLVDRIGDDLAGTTLDMSTNKVEVLLDQDQPTSTSPSNSVLSPFDLISGPPTSPIVPTLQEAAKFGIDVQIAFEDTTTGDALDTGLGLYYNNRAQCMTSFGVDINSGGQGTFTASHCNRHSGGVIINRFGQDQGYRFVADVDNDARLMRIPPGQSLSGKFQDSPTTFRGATGTIDRLDMLGASVCHYGIGSAKTTCGTVTDINRLNSTQVNPQVEVNGAAVIACGGDSGGPWFWGSVAFGIHSGSTQAPNTEVDDCQIAGQTATFAPLSETLDLVGATLYVENQSCALSNGVTRRLSASSGGSEVCTVQIPAGTTQFSVNMSGPASSASNEADLYVKSGSPGTILTSGNSDVRIQTATTCTQWADGNTETCTFTNPAPGTWHVTIADYGNRSFNNIAVNASWSSTPPPSTSPCGNGATWNVANRGGGGTERCTFDVPSGVSSLTFTMNGPAASTSNEADLYLRHNSAPSVLTEGDVVESATRTSCTMWVDGNTATCNITNPAAGTWHVLIADYNNSGFRNITTTTSW